LAGGVRPVSDSVPRILGRASAHNARGACADRIVRWNGRRIRFLFSGAAL